MHTKGDLHYGQHGKGGNRPRGTNHLPTSGAFAFCTKSQKTLLATEKQTSKISGKRQDKEEKKVKEKATLRKEKIQQVKKKLRRGEEG